jgi:flagellar motility protein MotE (MotC chaperone)
MAKKDEFIDFEEKKGNKFVTLLIALVIIALWLGMFALCIKLDVGGFGSSVMYPIFKNVPVINKILPDKNVEEDDEYPYNSLAEAINYIKDLEREIKNLKDSASADAEKIADLQAEIDRLKAFEESQLAFEKQKEQYYNEVVFGDNAIDYEYYKQYYEQISPEYAEVLYKQVLEKYLYDERYKDLADAYATMKPKKAAAALYEMTGNLETVVAILQNIEVEARAKILDALSDTDAVFCAKITVMLSPQ